MSLQEEEIRTQKHRKDMKTREKTKTRKERGLSRAKPADPSNSAFFCSFFHTTVAQYMYRYGYDFG